MTHSKCEQPLTSKRGEGWGWLLAECAANNNHGLICPAVELMVTDPRSCVGGGWTVELEGFGSMTNCPAAEQGWLEGKCRLLL